MRYALPSLLQASSLGLAWIQPSLNIFLPDFIMVPDLNDGTNHLLHRQTVFFLEPTFDLEQFRF